MFLYLSHLLPALSQRWSSAVARNDTDTALAVIAGLSLVLRLQRWPNIKLALTTHEN